MLCIICFEYCHNFYIFMLLSTVETKIFYIETLFKFWLIQNSCVFRGRFRHVSQYIQLFKEFFFFFCCDTHNSQIFLFCLHVYTNVCVFISVFVVYWCILLSHVHVVIFEDCHKITAFFWFNFYELTENNCNYCSKSPALY